MEGYLDDFGFEVLAENEHFSVTMDFDTARIDVFFLKSSPMLSLVCKPVDWAKLVQLLGAFKPTSKSEEPTRIPGFGLVEKVADTTISVEIRVLHVSLSIDRFRSLREIIRRADRKIVRITKRRGST